MFSGFFAKKKKDKEQRQRQEVFRADHKAQMDAMSPIAEAVKAYDVEL